MQAIILAAGKSSRLFPFGGSRHKAALSLMGKSLIQRTVENLHLAGVLDIVIVVSSGNGIEEALRDSGINLDGIVFITHEGAFGMGEALLGASSTISGDFFLLHAHHFECEKFVPQLLLRKKESGGSGAIVVREETNPEAFGIVKLEDGRIVEVIEKPENATEKFRIVGMYLLPKDFLKVLKETKKHHYSFETALNDFVKKDHIGAVIADQETLTLKYPWHILDLSDYLLSCLKRKIASDTTIAKSAVIEGEVVISRNVKIEDGAVIHGPCYIGEGVYIGTHAILRGGVMLEKDCVVGANMELKHSVLMEKSTTHSGYIGDSVIGNQCKVAAFFCTGNVRIDRSSVKVTVKDEVVDSRKNSLGVFIGDDTRLGIRVSTMPGILIGKNVTVGPSTTVFKNIGDDVRYYAKITEVITKNNDTSTRRSLGKKKVVLFDIDYTLFDTKAFKHSNLQTFSVYKEVVDALSEIGAYAELGIFSEGDGVFQKEKLLQTAIAAHFLPEHVHIVTKKQDSIVEILQMYKDVSLFLVDDRPEVLALAKKHKPDAFTIFMKRGPFAASQTSIEGFSPDASIEDLRMVLGIVAQV